MFKEGDYVVCLKKNNGRFLFIAPNYIFKQKYNDNNGYAKVDLTGYGCKFYDIEFKDINSVWRYATPSEIAEYERLGKPFDVTTIVSVPVNNDYTYLVKFLKKLGIK